MFSLTRKELRWFHRGQLTPKRHTKKIINLYEVLPSVYYSGMAPLEMEEGYSLAPPVVLEEVTPMGTQ